MTRFLPLLLGAALAVAVALVATSIDRRYEATATTRVQTVFEIDQVDDLLLLAGLTSLSESTDSPTLPGGAASLERVESRTASRLRWATPFESDDVRVIDTRTELVPPTVADPIRRLKVKAVADSPERAANLANAYLEEYLRERDRVTERLLRAAGERLGQASTPNLSRVSGPGRRELVDATRIAGELHGGILPNRVVPASAPGGSISPRPVRDALVAGLIGLLGGWLLTRRRGSRAR